MGGVVDADSEGDIITSNIGTPVRLVQIMAEASFELDGRRLSRLSLEG